jgi:hypothetical protein
VGEYLTILWKKNHAKFKDGRLLSWAYQTKHANSRLRNYYKNNAITYLPPRSLIKTIHNFITKNFTLEPSIKGHLSRWFLILQNYIPLALKMSDKCSKMLAPLFKNKTSQTQSSEGATIYTDGSKIDSDCGSGFIIKWNNQTRLGLNYNGKFYMVFFPK